MFVAILLLCFASPITAAVVLGLLFVLTLTIIANERVCFSGRGS